MLYCGLCEQCLDDWDKHSTNPDHVRKLKEFFTDEAKGIERLQKHLHITSNLNAHIIYIILKGEYAR